ncbi:uncharacterized protein LOC130653792 [Hydractinia symbiolongicarpus]|uniref:uncharacterized protein LOC130653792 n=1 Tax=Hydractinia symbiolongicarpus TaxID=13093 RepID=UPI0025505E1D|nr:uncharacterized protein LOC130653792 [Hydractinia symbiolongicarpus]
MIAEKRKINISVASSWVRTKICFALIHACLLCLRGSRGIYKRIEMGDDIVLSELSSCINIVKFLVTNHADDIWEEGLKKSKQEVKCIIHNNNYKKETKLRAFTEKSAEKVKIASEIRNDENVTDLVSGDLSDLKFHQKCLDAYVHPKTLATIQKKKEKAEASDDETGDVNDIEEQQPTSTIRMSQRKRGRTGQSLAKQDECCICQKRKTSTTGSGYEKLSKCITESSALTLQTAALQNGANDELIGYISGRDWTGIVALELRYHVTCYRAFTKPVKTPSAITQVDKEALQHTFDFVELHALNKCEVLLTFITSIP